MNKRLQAVARGILKEGLYQLPKAWQDTFKLMYGRLNGKRSVPDTKAMDINQVVDEMESNKLDWAMEQVENSIKKYEHQIRLEWLEVDIRVRQTDPVERGIILSTGETVLLHRGEELTDKMCPRCERERLKSCHKVVVRCTGPTCDYILASG